MVTKMKMFGFLPTPTNAAANVKSNANASNAKSTSNFNMKNLASIMKVKNTGCKSCRG